MTAKPKPHFFNTGEMIHYLCLEKRLTLMEIAQNLGVSTRYLNSLTRGDREPTIEQVDQLRRMINADINNNENNG